MKGIIYKITCNETGEVYYGSTQKSLSKRIISHKSKCKAWKEGKYAYTTSFNIIDRGNYSYVLIETVDCEDRKQLEAREHYYIENNECINKILVGRTKKAYYEANKDTIKELNKTRYETNKDAIKQQHKAYRESNMEAIKEQKKAYREANREAINEKRRQQYLKNKLLKIL
jgi:hypothetical protein